MSDCSQQYSVWSLSTGLMVHVIFIGIPPIMLWHSDGVLNTKQMAGGEPRPGPVLSLKKKGLYDDFFERQPGTSPRSAEQLPLDSDSSRLKCEHRSGISCWFPLTASFIKLWKGKRNLRSVPADTDILEMMLLETASNPELRYLYSGIHCVDTKDPAGFILANRQQLSWMLSSFQVV